MTPVDLITRARSSLAAAAFDSDLARSLAITPQTLAQWKTEKRRIPDGLIVDLAELAALDPGYALAALHAHYTTGKLQGHWLEAARRLALWNANPSWWEEGARH
ncbi:MAG: hypothetical protein EOM24_36325 [Chloroflexia bacterium]|nr:hypothetical protein [Chloroflexia bacterium]